MADNHFLSAEDWYKWIAILTLEVGQVFFLFKSVAVKEKNPNELMSYLVLTSLMNIFFLYKLISDAVKIYRDYILYQETTPTGVTILSMSCFIMAILGVLGIMAIMLLIFLTILPLRESIYEDIFWQIGGNANVLAVYKART